MLNNSHCLYVNFTSSVKFLHTKSKGVLMCWTRISPSYISLCPTLHFTPICIFFTQFPFHRILPSLSVSCVQMAKCLALSLIILGLFIGLLSPQWNILNLGWGKRVEEVNPEWNILNRILREKVVGDNLKSYCESWRINVELNNIRGFSVVPQECVEHVKKYMTSSQYKADSTRAVEEIRLYLSGCCTLKGDGKDSWIFDIDETLLSTIPYYKKHGFGGEKLNLTSLEAWMKQSKAPALDHTLELFHEIKNRGFKIFLVSSRKESLRSATVDNLVNVGYHGWTTLKLRGFDDELVEVKNYHCKVREELVDEGYRIWGIVGDQWSTFDGLPIPNRTFKLPNSIYYKA